MHEMNGVFSGPSRSLQHSSAGPVSRAPFSAVCGAHPFDYEQESPGLCSRPIGGRNILSQSELENMLQVLEDSALFPVVDCPRISITL